jgi:hypothetical protein
MLRNTNQLQVGDIVRLNSGSPDLRIVDLDRVTVEWKNDQGETESAVYPSVCLTRLSSN